MSSILGDFNRIHVMSGGAPKEVFALLSPKFEQQTGNKVKFTYAVITELREKLGAGATADVLVLPAPVLDSLANDGKVRAIVGPLPAEINLEIVYGAAVATDSAAPDAASAFVKFMAAPENRFVWKEGGFEPPTNLNSN